MSGFDLEQLTGRLRRAAERNRAPDPTPRAPERRPDAPGSPARPAANHPAPPAGTSWPGRRRRRLVLPAGGRLTGPTNSPQPPELHVCPFCRKKHQPVRLGGGGLAEAYSRPVSADPYRPAPLGRDPGDTSSFRRDGFSPWRGRAAELPPTAAAGIMRDRIVAWWQGDESMT